MLRWGLNRVASAGARVLLNKSTPASAVVVRNSSHSTETEEELDARYISYFNRVDIDGWELRKGITDILRMDMVPEPDVTIAALKACRRINDYALTVRFLEAIKAKCGIKVNEIYPYIIQEVRPTLTELGISTPEELGYDVPELELKSIDDL